MNKDNSLYVHIVYTGIIGLNPRDNGTYDVFAPNGTHHHHAHFTWLLCHQAQVKSSSLSQVVLPMDVKIPECLIAFHVAGEMEVEGVESTTLTSWEGWEGCENLSYGERNLVNLYRSGKHKSEGVRLDPQLRKAGAANARVALRSKINCGEVDVDHVDCRVRWQLKRWLGAARWKERRELAQEVCNKMKVNDEGCVTIKFRRRKRETNLVLKRAAGKNASRDIVVFIGNTPLPDIFPKGKDFEHDKHVRLYHMLSETSATPVEKLPYLRYKVAEGKVTTCHDHSLIGENGSRATGSNCPPGTWEDDDGA